MTDTRRIALAALVQQAGITRHDTLIPGALGKPFVCPTTGYTSFWFRRPGSTSEFKVRFIVEESKPFVNPNGLPEYREKSE